MLLKSRTRRARGALRPVPHPALDPNTLPLPAGYTRTLHPGAPAPDVQPAPAPTGAPVYPPVTGVLAELYTACGCIATLHPAEYAAPDRTGAPTEHGYAWRCTGCTRVRTGYPAAGFGRALADGRTHECEVHP